MNTDTAHLIFRGSARFREDYEVQSRSTGKRLGYVKQHAPHDWQANADADGTWATGKTMREAALALWPRRRPA